jgi:uroporphyrinogen-III synthase
MSRIIILRPQPGADATAERARALGLEAEVLPLFIVRAAGMDTARSRPL